MNAEKIAELLRQSVGEDRVWPADLGPDTRLDGDLLLEDADMAAFGDALRQRFGDRVDLVGFVADLDIDLIIALTVAGVAQYVAGCCDIARPDATDPAAAPAAARTGPA